LTAAINWSCCADVSGVVDGAGCARAVGAMTKSAAMIANQRLIGPSTDAEREQIS